MSLRVDLEAAPLRAVLELAGRRAELIEHATTAWASVSFSGERHRIVLRFVGADAVEDATALAAVIGEHEFNLAGQIVADAAVVATRYTPHEPTELMLTVELLVVEEA